MWMDTTSPPQPVPLTVIRDVCPCILWGTATPILKYLADVQAILYPPNRTVVEIGVRGWTCLRAKVPSRRCCRSDNTPPQWRRAVLQSYEGFDRAYGETIRLCLQMILTICETPRSHRAADQSVTWPTQDPPTRVSIALQRPG